MSEADVARIREGFLALDREGVDGLLTYIAPDFEGVVPPDLSLEPDTYRGHDGIRRYFETFAADVDELRFTADELIDDGDAVILILRVSGRGRGSRIPIDWAVVNRLRLRDGMVVSITAHATIEDARATSR